MQTLGRKLRGKKDSRVKTLIFKLYADIKARYTPVFTVFTGRVHR